MNLFSKKLLILLIVGFLCSCLSEALQAQDQSDETVPLLLPDQVPMIQPPDVQIPTPEQQPPQKLTLSRAVMCEGVQDTKPVNIAIAFPVSIGQVCCFTTFDHIPEAITIYHRWFHRDELSTQIRLKLYPPQWSTYSLIQLRDTDKGPWRVEITDHNGMILDILRFSITD